MAYRVKSEQLGEVELEERVIQIDRVKKTVAGGQIISFRALVVVGDRNGHVGFAIGKARGTPDAIRKGVEKAKKNMIRVPLKGSTIPHQVTGKMGSITVMLKPASRGTGTIASTRIRPLLELAGIRDVLTKVRGSKNAMNAASATFEALKSVRDPVEVAELRGKTVAELFGLA